MLRRHLCNWFWMSVPLALIVHPTVALAQAADAAPKAENAPDRADAAPQGDEAKPILPEREPESVSDSNEPAPPAPEAAPDSAGEPAEEDKMPPPGYVPGHRVQNGLGLSPHAPGMQSILPGAIAPSFGTPVQPAQGGKLDLQGYVQAGARVGYGKRERATSDQHITTWHGDPLVPRGNVFETTNNVPYTWAELRFIYSRPMVQSTVSIGAWSLAESGDAGGSYLSNAQLWIRDAFVTYTPLKLDKKDPVDLTWKVGVYEDRYGAMAQYSTGVYGAPIVATIAGVGETLTAAIPTGPLKLFLEHGIKTSLGRPSAEAPTGPSHNWLKPWEGQTFVNHAHVGFDWEGKVRPALHYIAAASRDDTGDHVPLGNLRAGYDDYEGGQPETYPQLDHADGSLRVLGADVHFNLQRFGYLVLGASQTKGEYVRTLNGIVQVLNAGGGRDLMDRYFGRNNDLGRGTLSLAGFEYSVSLGTLLRYPGEFWGEGPDLNVSLFGMYGQVAADDPARDGQQMLKFGGEAVYSPLSWLALAARYDRSTPYLKQPSVPLYNDQNDNTFQVLTAKLVFRSDWNAREALTLQYSRYIYRPNYHLVTLNAGGQVSSVTDEPDRDLVALYGTLWW